ncbi:MAG TPA: DinB family protein [Gemmatimonadales bacterium]|nr:DinB family protein [Gemmatimonadales bacterium]
MGRDGGEVRRFIAGKVTEVPPVDFDLEKTILLLARTPRVLHALLAGLSTEWTSANEGPDTWSPFDVVGHLIDGEETDWMVRARIILAQGASRRFEPFDRSRHNAVNRNRTVAQLLARFEVLRKANIAELRALNLSPEQMELTGEHPDFGSVTLQQLLATWVVHDLGHVAQISRVMAKQYADAVGPWKAYLPILQR